MFTLPLALGSLAHSLLGAMVSFGVSGASGVSLVALFGPFWAVLGPFWAVWRHLGGLGASQSSWEPLGALLIASSRSLGPSWGPWTVFGLSWAVLGTSWAVLGLSRGPLGSS